MRSSMPPRSPALRAALILALWALLVLLGTPGLDFLNAKTLRTTSDQDVLRGRIGEPWTALAIQVTRFNREVRLPLAEAVGPLQRPFRVSQEWALYRDGPSKVRRLEVRVDGVLRHRSADAEHGWLAGVLRNRRVRPVVESTCTTETGANWRGLGRLVVARARAEWPDAATVELACTVAPFPGRDATVHHRYVATAPGWVVAPG
ncbi:MAG: hypothetical protein Q8P41_16895 [Pseudomonadota bacterium]|nr:hypothetical protein [Pseudomonadota bacterium]